MTLRAVAKEALRCLSGEVLERWQSFSAETSRLLSGLAAPARGAPAAGPLSVDLGLALSPVGRVVSSLSAAVREARRCVAEAQPLYVALSVFGETEADSLQTPPALLLKLAELLPELRSVRLLVRRVERTAEMLGLGAGSS